ncbi:MAG: FAD-binding oxidoreductase [Gammaproteobacteria bacterium]|nr:FAD-binding oxidoreductase [Gammaproteobacteria bacterium]
MADCSSSFDAIVIGGGFYGTSIALYLARQRGLKRVLLVEKESELLSRASYTNQARVHNGYHYPRSFTTAYRSRVNLPSFIRDYSFAVKQDFIKLYAIARRNSKVTSKQFVRFCQQIGANIEVAPPEINSLFEPSLIESVFCVEEYAFDTSKLALRASDDLIDAGVVVRLGATVTSLVRGTGVLQLSIDSQPGFCEHFSSKYVFNCTYSGLNQVPGSAQVVTELKHEITEMALVNVPPELKGLGITVMDGPFFSVMPFPARELHTLSHVRYTPHLRWDDVRGIDPYGRLKNYNCASRVDRMLRDVARYLPSISNSRYIDSLFEVKTILAKNEVDDGRPILFEKHPDMVGYYSILGGKIDNIYDVLEKLEEESFA